MSIVAIVVLLLVAGWAAIRWKEWREKRRISRAQRAASSGRLDESSAALRQVLAGRPNPTNLIPVLELIDDLAATAGLEAPPEASALRTRIGERRAIAASSSALRAMRGSTSGSSLFFGISEDGQERSRKVRSERSSAS